MSKQVEKSIAGRLPPYDHDAEGVVLSDILCADMSSQREVVSLISSIISNSSAFHSDANRYVFEAFCALDEANKPIDIHTAWTYLKTRNQDGVVGVGYLARLQLEIPSLYRAGVIAHAERIRDLKTKRDVIETARKIMVDGYDEVPDVQVWVAESVTALAKSARVGGSHRGVTARQATESLMKQLMNPDENLGNVFTEIVPIDRFMGPMKPGQVTLVMAYTSCGKSAYCSSVVTNVATTSAHVRCTGTDERRGCGWKGANPYLKPDADHSCEYRCIKCQGKIIPVAQGVIVFSQEMTPEEYQSRILASYADVEFDKIESGTATKEEWARFTEASQHCAVDHVRIVSDCSTIEEIVSTAHGIAHEMAREGYPLRLVIIDYAQRVRVGNMNGRRMSREEEVAEVGRSVKELATNLLVPVLMPGQLNDEARKKGERPSANNARESKALAMDADNVLIIYNEERQNAANLHHESEVPANDVEPVDFIVDKKRGGKKGTIRAAFVPRTTTFKAWNYEKNGDPWANKAREA